MRILLVDDDEDFVDLTGYALRRHGHLVMTVHDGGQALARVLADQPDLVLLNPTIADGDGFVLCRQIRERSAVPTMIVSAHGDEVAVVRGYEAGADDYIVKPFSPRQLLLRIDAVMRRSGAAENSTLGNEHQRLCVGDLTLDSRAFELRKNGVRLRLTRIEFRILTLLVRSTGTLVESRRLSEYAWQSPMAAQRGLLKTHISHIRRKFNEAGGRTVQIRSVPRLGYLLSFEAERSTATDPVGVPDRQGWVPGGGVARDGGITVSVGVHP